MRGRGFDPRPRHSPSLALGKQVEAVIPVGAVTKAPDTSGCLGKIPSLALGKQVKVVIPVGAVTKALDTSVVWVKSPLLPWESKLRRLSQLEP